MYLRRNLLDLDLNLKWFQRHRGNETVGGSVRLAHRIAVRDLDYLHSIDDANAKDKTTIDRERPIQEQNHQFRAQNGKSQKRHCTLLVTSRNISYRNSAVHDASCPGKILSNRVFWGFEPIDWKDHERIGWGGGLTDKADFWMEKPKDDGKLLEGLAG